MAWPALPPLSPWFAVEFVNGLVMFGIAAAILRLDHRPRVNQLLVLLLVVRGTLNVGLAFAESSPEPFGTDYWGRVSAYFALAMPFVLLAFVHEYRARYAKASRVRAAPVALLAAALALELVFVADHGLFFSGPLILIGPLFYLVYGLLALLFAKDAAGRPASDPRRGSSVRMAVAFGLLPAYTGAFYAGRLLFAAGAALGVGAGPPIRPPAAVGVAVALLFVGAGLLPLGAARRLRRETVHGGTDAGPATLGLAAATALVPLGLIVAGLPYAGPLDPLFVDRVHRVFEQVWTGAFPILVAYALVRHQLLDIDVKVKFGLERGTLAAIFLAAFFVASELVKAFFEERVGLVAGVLAAAALVFALAPLQRVAHRLADAAMPGVKAVGEMTADERVALYRQQLQVAYADGAVDRNERMLLESLRERLRISGDDALRLEREVAPPG